MNLTLEAYALNTSPVATFSYILQLCFSLLVVIGLIYLTGKFILPRLQVKTKGRLIEVVERIGIEPGVNAYILKVKQAAWLIMVSNKQVSKIEKLEEGV